MATKKQTKKKDNENGNGESTALVVLDKGGYALAKFTPAELREAIGANFADDELTPNDLDRVRVPSGGGTAWAIPTLEGDEDMVKQIEGVIVHYRPARAYWSQSLDESGGGSPPDCSAPDGKHGVGEPGGACAACPLNQFGSASDGGRGKACKEMRLLFILKPDSLLPLVLVLPPTSIKPFKKYLQRLTSAAVPYSKVQSTIGLEKTKNKDNIEFAQATFKVVEKLDPASADHVAAYAESMRAAFEAVEITADDAAGTADV
jgi:hypothetical protein